VQIYRAALEPYKEENRKAWAGILVLLLLILVLNILVRVLMRVTGRSAAAAK